MFSSSGLRDNTGFVHSIKWVWHPAMILSWLWLERMPGSGVVFLSQSHCSFPLPFQPVQDEKYWQRRKKNNVAAKRSRDARRLKENQITVRAAFLERENAALRLEVADLRKECGHYKNIAGNYEAKYGPL